MTKNLYLLSSCLIFHPEYFLYHGKIIALKRIQKHVSGICVDVGCGEKIFKQYIDKKISYYWGLEYPQTLAASFLNSRYSKIDVAGNAEALPVKNESIDTILLLDILEHIRKPEYVMQQAYYSLKINGHAVITTPFLYPLHMEPYDFYRFTKNGIEALANMSGFTIVENFKYGKALETFAVNSNLFIFYEIFKLNKLVKKISLIKKVLLVMVLPLFLLIAASINVVAMIAGLFFDSDKYPAGYCTVLKKTEIFE